MNSLINRDLTMIKRSILKASLVATLAIPTISMAATTPDTTVAPTVPWYTTVGNGFKNMLRPFQSHPQTFVIKNEITGARIGTIDSVKNGCTVSENNGQTIKVTCENIFPSN